MMSTVYIVRVWHALRTVWLSIRGIMTTTRTCDTAGLLWGEVSGAKQARVRSCHTTWAIQIWRSERSVLAPSPAPANVVDKGSTNAIWYEFYLHWGGNYSNVLVSTTKGFCGFFCERKLYCSYLTKYNVQRGVPNFCQLQYIESFQSVAVFFSERMDSNLG